MNQASSVGKWFDDPILPGIIRWHDGSKFTGLAGKSSEIFYFIQTMKGNLGIMEPFSDPNETLLEPTPTDVEILNTKLIDLRGGFPAPDEFRALWKIPNTSDLEPGWKELTDDPEHYVYWYGVARSEPFKKEHVVAADFMFPAQVAAYVATLPTVSISETSTTNHESVYAGPVSSTPAPDNPDKTIWMIDPEDSRAMIFWNGDEWSKRKLIKSFIDDYLASLGITMPEAWSVEHSHSRRDFAILELLLEMSQGQAWVRDPESDFYDLKVRWWDGKQFTDAVGADPAGWYDAPNDVTQFQWWNGSSWDKQFLDKQQVQIEEERREAARAAKTAFVMKVITSAVDGYRGGSTASEREATRQRNKQIQRAADNRSSDQWWEARRKEKQDEAIRQQTKFYRRANERRR